MTISHPPADPAPPPAGSGVMGYFAAHKMLVGIIGIAAAAVIAVAVALATGVVGMGAEAGSSGGWEDMQNFISVDSTIVMIINFDALFEFEEAPKIADEMGWGSDYDDYPGQWKHEFMISIISPLENGPGQFADGITRAVTQGDGQGNDLDAKVVMGDFRFDAIRDFLNDKFEKSGTYHGFEVWDKREEWDDESVALLENQGAVISGDEFTSILRSQDTGKGTIAAVTKDSDQGWELKQALEKAGDGLVTFAAVECADMGSDYIVDSLHSCDAFVAVVKDGASDFIEGKGALVFSSASRAEAFMNELDESDLDVDIDIDIDIDIESIETDGRFVSVEINFRLTSLADILGF